MSMNIDLPYLVVDTDRHGNARLYVRKDGRKIRIREQRGTAEFATAYAAAIESLAVPKAAGRAYAAGSFGWLASRYFASKEFQGLDAGSQTTRRRVIESCLQEPMRPGSKDLIRDCPARLIGPKHIKMLRDRKGELLGAANNRLKYLSAMFGWAIEAELAETNPVRDTRKKQYSSEGFYTWSVEDVQKFEAFYPIGTKARLAFGLLLFLGLRRSDMVRLGRQHEEDGGIRLAPKKTLKKRKTKTWKPILPVLRHIIDNSPTGDLTYLTTTHGLAFSAKGFGERMRKWCDKAGLPDCTSHGLRKAGATIAAENGATVPQLMALYDWTTPAQAMEYVRAADQKKMAGITGALVANIGGVP